MQPCTTRLLVCRHCSLALSSADRPPRQSDRFTFQEIRKPNWETTLDKTPSENPAGYIEISDIVVFDPISDDWEIWFSVTARRNGEHVGQPIFVGAKARFDVGVL